MRRLPEFASIHLLEMKWCKSRPGACRSGRCEKRQTTSARALGRELHYSQEDKFGVGNDQVVSRGWGRKREQIARARGTFRAREEISCVSVFNLKASEIFIMALWADKFPTIKLISSTWSSTLVQGEHLRVAWNLEEERYILSKPDESLKLSYNALIELVKVLVSLLEFDRVKEIGHVLRGEGLLGIGEEEIALKIFNVVKDGEPSMKVNIVACEGSILLDKQDLTLLKSAEKSIQSVIFEGTPRAPDTLSDDNQVLVQQVPILHPPAVEVMAAPPTESDAAPLIHYELTIPSPTPSPDVQLEPRTASAGGK